MLRDPHMQLRTDYQPYMEAVAKFFDKALKIINRHQFTSDGPVIMLQIENEFGGRNARYLQFLYNLVTTSGFKQQLFTSDPNGGGYPIRNIFPKNDVLETANLNQNSYNSLKDLKEKQGHKPLYVSEFWPGWFDAWGERGHHTYSVQQFDHEISDILFKV